MGFDTRRRRHYGEDRDRRAMKTQYYTASSLDGFIADPEHSLDWLFQFGDIEETDYPDFIRAVGAIAMGSTTYEWILRHHMGPDADHPQAWSYEQPTWVFTSRSLPTVAGADIRFVGGDVRPVHEQMVEAAGERNVWIVGGGDLVGQFYDHGLLDELLVSVAPVTLGGGAPLLPRAITKPPLRLVSVRTFNDAFAQLVYEVPRHQSRSR
jgi:dihydrofolate reductase